MVTSMWSDNVRNKNPEKTLSCKNICTNICLDKAHSTCLHAQLGLYICIKRLSRLLSFVQLSVYIFCNNQNLCSRVWHAHLCSYKSALKQLLVQSFCVETNCDSCRPVIITNFMISKMKSNLKWFVKFIDCECE